MFNLTITIPTVQRDGSLVQDLEIVQNMVAKQLCEWFGGCTATPGKGSWVDSQGKVVSEEVTVFSTLTDSDKRVYILEGLANHVKKVCNQEAVLFTVQKMDTVKFV